MAKLLDYATEELRRADMLPDPDSDSYQDDTALDILELIKLFESQESSGAIAGYVIATFRRLAMFQPLTPLTGEDDEWVDVGHGLLQNRRCFSVFKENGKAYDINGKIFSKDNGKSWFVDGNSTVPVSFPYSVPDGPEKIQLRAEPIDPVETV